MKLSERFLIAAELLEAGEKSYICTASGYIDLSNGHEKLKKLLKSVYLPENRQNYEASIFNSAVAAEIWGMDEEASSDYYGEYGKETRILACCFLSHIAADLEAVGEL
jgi:hypothetical protein